MRRIIAYSQNEGILNPVELEDKVIIKPTYNVQQESDVFDMIYAPDPVTGLPVNALGVFLNSDTSPLVRDFIASQLKATDNSNPVLPEGVDDEVLAILTRDRNESLSQYTSRVKDYMVSERSAYHAKVKAEYTAYLNSQVAKKPKIEVESKED